MAADASIFDHIKMMSSCVFVIVFVVVVDVLVLPDLMIELKKRS